MVWMVMAGCVSFARGCRGLYWCGRECCGMDGHGCVSFVMAGCVSFVRGCRGTILVWEGVLWYGWSWRAV